MPSPSLLSSCALCSVLQWPEAVSCWSILHPFCPLLRACAHNLLTISASNPPLIPLVLSWSCQPSVLPVPRPLRHVSGQQRWRLWGGGGRFFTCSVWVQVHGCTVWPVFVCASVGSEPPACPLGLKGSSLTAHTNASVVLETPHIYHRLVWHFSFVI